MTWLYIFVYGFTFYVYTFAKSGNTRRPDLPAFTSKLEALAYRPIAVGFCAVATTGVFQPFELLNVGWDNGVGHFVL